MAKRTGGKRLSIISARFAGSALQLVLTLALTRTTDPALAAACLLQFSWVQLSSAAMAWGHPVAILREASARYVDGGGYALLPHLRWVALNGMAVGAVGATIFVVALRVDLPIAVMVVVAGLVQGLLRAVSQAMKAYEREVSAILLEFALVPAVLVVAALSTSGGISTLAFAAAQVGATLVAFAAIAGLWMRGSGSRPAESNDGPTRVSGLHKLGVLQVLTIGAAQMPIVVAPAILDAESVAAFVVAFRVASIVTTVQNALSGYYGPRYARAFARRSKDEVRRLLINSQLVAAALCAPIVLVIPWAGSLLEVFGEAYSQAALAYAIVAVGQYVNAVTGLVSYVLSLSGQEGVLLLVNTAAIVVLAIGWGGQWATGDSSLAVYSVIFSMHMILRNLVNYALARRVIRGIDHAGH